MHRLKGKFEFSDGSANSTPCVASEKNKLLLSSFLLDQIEQTSLSKCVWSKCSHFNRSISSASSIFVQEKVNTLEFVKAPTNSKF